MSTIFLRSDIKPHSQEATKVQLSLQNRLDTFIKLDNYSVISIDEVSTTTESMEVYCRQNDCDDQSYSPVEHLEVYDARQKQFWSLHHMVEEQNDKVEAWMRFIENKRTSESKKDKEFSELIVACKIFRVKSASLHLYYGYPGNTLALFDCVTSPWFQIEKGQHEIKKIARGLDIANMRGAVDPEVLRVEKTTDGFSVKFVPYGKNADSIPYVKEETGRGYGPPFDVLYNSFISQRKARLPQSG